MTAEFHQALLYFKILKQIISDKSVTDITQVIEESVRRLSCELISQQNQRLLQLAFQTTITQSDLDSFLQHWDIEVAGADRAAILAYMMKMHPELKFDAYTGPRLKGLLNYLRFQNLDLIGHFSKIVRRLNESGIEPMIIKGGAMRYLRPELPRVMGDIDILLPVGSSLKPIQKLVYEMGYVFSDNVHSIDVHPADHLDKGILDIHQFFSFMPRVDRKFIDNLFQRATRQKIFLSDVYLPAPEDMVFICLNNLTNNLRHASSVHGIPLALFDLSYLIGLKENFDWDIVIEDMRQTHTEAYSYIAVRFIDRILPNLFPNNLIKHKILQRSLADMVYRDKFYTFWVHDVKYACKQLKFSKSWKNWADLKHYMKVEGQHFITKRIVKHPLLIRLFFKIFDK